MKESDIRNIIVDWLENSYTTSSLYKISNDITYFNGGNVGFGTTNPTLGKIHVVQNSDAYNEGITVVDTTGAARAMYLWINGSNSMISSGTTGTGNLILNNGGGKVGIGTTPSNMLHVLSTTAPQFRISYDAGSYATLSVANGGDLTIACGEATGKITLTPGASDNTVSTSGVFYSSRGRYPASTILLTSTTEDAVFDTMSAYIPNTNDAIIISGSMDPAGYVCICNKAIRLNSTTIRIYWLRIDTSALGYTDIVNGSSDTIDSIALSW